MKYKRYSCPDSYKFPVFSRINDIREHGSDERILKKSLYEGQEFLYRLVKELSVSD